MKICLHTPFKIDKGYIGGTERFIVKLAKELEVLGFEVIIVCSNMPSKYSVEGIEVIGSIPPSYTKRFNSFNSTTEFFIQQIIGKTADVDSLKRFSEFTQFQISNINADVFHFNSLISSTFISLKKKQIVTNHENPKELQNKWGVGINKALINAMNSKTTSSYSNTMFVVPSKYYSDIFSNMFKLPFKFIHQGVHLNDFKYFNKKSNSKCLQILFPARFSVEQKGHMLMLECCRIMKKRKFDFKITFSGATERYTHSIEEFLIKVNKYRLTKEVRISKFANMNEAYGACDIVVSTEKYCSFGLSISESLSLGIPTVLSTIPTYVEIASKFKHAIFFDLDSVEDLFDKILIASDIKFNGFRIEAINFRNKYDMRECAKNYAQLYLS